MLTSVVEARCFELLCSQTKHSRGDHHITWTGGLVQQISTYAQPIKDAVSPPSSIPTTELFFSLFTAPGHFPQVQYHTAHQYDTLRNAYCINEREYEIEITRPMAPRHAAVQQRCTAQCLDSSFHPPHVCTTCDMHHQRPLICDPECLRSLME